MNQHKAMVVVTWDPKDPRSTVTVDGFYFSEGMAQEVLAGECESGRTGFMASVLYDAAEIPYELHPGGELPAAK